MVGFNLQILIITNKLLLLTLKRSKSRLSLQIKLYKEGQDQSHVFQAFKTKSLKKSFRAIFREDQRTDF